MTSYRAPSPDEVNAVLLKIPTFQLRRVFYEGLLNPRWVRPLFNAGALSNPPEPQETDDGYIRDVYWPEISYLIRVAPEVPKDVVDVLLALKDTNNAWVKRAVFEVGSKIPAAEAARLQPLLKAWMATGFGWRTDPRDLVSFSIALLEGGETKVGRWLADYLFQPRPPKSNDAFRREPEVTLEEYWYREELPRLLPALGESALRTVSRWLARYAKLAGHAGDEYDYSGMLRPSIRSVDNGYPSVEDALVDAVTAVAIPEMLNDPDATTKVLLGSGVQLLRKIAMFVVAEAIRRRLAKSLSAQYLVPVGEKLLGDESSDDDNLRVEYAELAQAVANVDPSALQVINNLVAHAYAEDLRWMRERLVEEGTSEDQALAEITERADRYKHRWLTAIGAAALPPQLRTELAELDTKCGVIDGALTPNGTMTSWSGPNPYSGQDEMAAMSPTELVAHLASWHDTGERWGPGPSHEGQGREVARLLTTNPLALTGVGSLVQQLRPTYLRAILQGWEAALKADLELHWPEVADLIQYVLAHDDKSPFPAEGDKIDDDRGFRWAKSAAVGLLEELVKKRETISVPTESLAQFAALLIDDAQDEQAWVEYDGYEHGQDSSDALTMSLNWQWPKRVRALMNLATRPEEGPWKPRAIAALEGELARNDKHGAGYAVVGESTARLLNNIPQWLEAHVDEWFGTERGLSVQQQIALTTALATHYYHRRLYDLFSGPMVAAIGLGGSIVSGWRSESKAEQRIGEWALEALIYGHKTSEDPVIKTFFTTASAKVRGAALGTIAWSFFRATSVEDAIRDRFAELWDERIQHVRDHPGDSDELKGFYWLAKGENYPVDWWLPRLQDVLELEPAIATERYMIGKELAQASLADPGTALTVLRLLLDERDEGGMASMDLSRNAVPVVLANAMSAGDIGLKKSAEDYMNRLGAKGNLQLESEVNAVLEGKVTVADVDE